MLIEKNKAVEKLSAIMQLHKNYATLDRPFENGCIAGLENAIKILKNGAPAVEAEPVRHGHWIENPTEYYKEWVKVFGNDRFFAECEYFTDHIACSNCLKIYNYIDNDSTDEWNYCPNCGAKMDGDPS